MKLRIFPDLLLLFFALLGILSLADELWVGPTPDWLSRFLQAHHLWEIWLALRWEHMYTHEVLHFLSGVLGSTIGCWIYFALQKRVKRSEPSTRAD